MRLLLLFIVLLSATVRGQNVVVGSKPFTEGYIMGEIARRQIEGAGVSVEHKEGIGSTGIIWAALKGRNLGVYCDYTGTISEEILKRPGLDLKAMREALRGFGIGMTEPLGFKDNYGLVVTRKTSERLGLKTISDLAGHPELRVGLTPELYERSDGWRGLAAKYSLRPEAGVKTLQHALAYRAIGAGELDVTDCYTTDAEIKTLDLTVLRDDRGHFPLYEAVYLYQLDAPAKAIAALKALEGTFDDRIVIEMNALATKDKDYVKAAALYFDRAKRSDVGTQKNSSIARTITKHTLDHLALVGISLFAAILIGIPLGIAASRPGWGSGAILGVIGTIQTIPSLALLALLVPLPFLGISPRTAVVALLLYSLLPIVRNTAVGLSGIPIGLRESAEALGLEPGARLRKLDLPMAFPLILAGIETSAIINVGTATLAALIGGGGLGVPIFSGIAINDNRTILTGAIPAAMLALLVQGLFGIIRRAVIPRGLR